MLVNERHWTFHPERNDEVFLLKILEARYVVTVITRVRDSTGEKNEYVYSKGRLEGFNASGRPEIMHIAKTGDHIKNRICIWTELMMRKQVHLQFQQLGPSKTYEVYDLSFTPDNVKVLL
jgi:hypothetical protein